MKQKEQRVECLGILSGTLGANLLGSIFVVRQVIKAELVME